MSNLSALRQLMHSGSPDVSSKEDWSTFVYQRQPRRPDAPSLATYRAMTSASRAEFDEQRMTYICRFTMTTTAMRKIHRDSLRMLQLNLRKGPGARPGAVIDGMGGLGKTR